MVAAKRGREALVGNLRTALNHWHWWPQGVFRDKSLSPAARKATLHKGLADAGFLVSDQDAEYGLLSRDYGAFAARRSNQTLATVTTVLNSVPYDASGLAGAHPEARGKSFKTGSPSADLWRSEFDEMFGTLPLAPEVHERPFVLTVSNSAVLGHAPFWNRTPKEHERGADGETRAKWERARHVEWPCSSLICLR